MIKRFPDWECLKDENEASSQVEEVVVPPDFGIEANPDQSAQPIVAESMNASSAPLQNQHHLQLDGI